MDEEMTQRDRKDLIRNMLLVSVSLGISAGIINSRC